MAMNLRLPEDLEKELAKYAKENDMSKTKAIKKAIRELIAKQSTQA